MRNGLLVLCVIGAFSQATLAQPSIRVEPDSILFGNRPGAVNVTHVVNRGGSPLQIDSLSFMESTSSGWWVEVETPDSTFRDGYAFGSLESGAFPTVLLQPNDSMRIELLQWGCLICKTAFGSLVTVADTLFIHSSDISRPVTSVPIDVRYWVGVESNEDIADESIQVFPNPLSTGSVATFTAAETGSVEVVVFDQLGREVSRERRTSYRGELVSVDLARRALNLPPGIYILGVRSKHRALSRHFVVTH